MRIVLLLMICLGAFFSMATSFADRPKDAGNADYNVGIALFGEMSAEELEGFGLGLLGNGEFAFTDRFDASNGNGEHVLVVEGRFLNLIGGEYSADGDMLFALKLLGSLSGGIQAYYILPLNLSFEDVQLEIRGSDFHASGLIGTTFYVPIPLDRESLFYAGITAGVNPSSDLSVTPFTLQGKLRYLDDDITAEFRYKQTFNNDVYINRQVFQFGWNHILGKGSQLGILLQRTDVRDYVMGYAERNLEFLLFGAGNL